jgi:hypothetical protein
MTGSVPGARPSGSGMTFLVGGVLLLAVTALLATIVPLAVCPHCEGKGEQMIVTAYGTHPYYRKEPCLTCANRGKVSLFKKWNLHRIAPAR